MLIGLRSRPLRKNTKALSVGAFAFSCLISFGASVAWSQAGTIVEVRSAKSGGLLSEKLADQIRSIEGVKGVEKYILKRADPHPVIGLEPGAPLRVLEGGKFLSPEKGAGRWLRPGDRYAAIVGNVYKEDYGMRMSGMAMMRHRFEVGSSFRLPGAKRRVRVVGKFAVEPASAAKKIILPLSAVQEIFSLEGKVTHFFVTLKSPGLARKVSEAIRSLFGEGARVRVH